MLCVGVKFLSHVLLSMAVVSFRVKQSPYLAKKRTDLFAYCSLAF